MLKLYRNKNVITGLAALSVFLFGATVAFGSLRPSDRRISYRTNLGHDLDGDHIPETATIRRCGSLYSVSIHFTTGRPKLRLTTYVTEGLAGLSLQTIDVNDDSKSDLVIVSATSIRPLAVWVNEGKAKFQKASSWVYGPLGRYTGPTVRHRSVNQPEPVGNVFIDPLPQATSAVESFGLEKDSADLISSQPDQMPFDSMLRQVPSRGPPAASHV